MATKYLVQHRRGTAAQWAEQDTLIPREGEIVIEIDEVNSLHKLKIGDGVHTYAELAYLKAGDEIVTQVLAEAKPRVITVELSESWAQDSDDKYYQTLTLEGITAHSRLDLQPSVDMLAEFKQLGLVFVTENNSGVITVYSVGNMPQKAYTMQATIVETECDGEDACVIGAPIGTPVAQSNWTQTDNTKADFIKNKPTLGALAAKDEVAKTDLASDVQASLGKADTAIQSIDGLATEDYVDSAISAIPTPDVSGQIETHNTNTSAHNDIRNLITELTNRLNTLANSDDITLDQMAEVVAYIKSNRSLIEEVTTNKVNVADIIDNLTTNVSNKPLSAAQGVALKALIDAITVPTKISELTNDSGYLTSYTETDPTVPAWAKEATKPSYTAAEVGAVPFTRKVNGKELSDDIVLDDVAVSQFKEQFAIGDTADEISSVTEWTQATVPGGFNSRERGCCYGNGYYVVAGTSGQMVYSRDCVTWTLVPAFTSAVITGLTYGNGLFASVDSDGNVFTAATPNGTWEAGLDAGGVINAVRYINNRFVAVGEEGFIATSKDGRSWNVITAFNDPELYFTDCTWGNGYYIAVGKAGAVWRSVTLSDWEDCTIPDFGDIRTTRFVAGGFVVGGASGHIAYSADGKTWSMATNNSALTISYVRDFAYAEKRIYAFSYASNGKGEIWLSTNNGATWTVVLTTAGRLWCAAYGDGRFVTSGDNGAIYTLNLDIDWTDEEPSEGASIWHRYITTLSNGDKVISESYKCANVVGNLNLILDAINGEVV